MEHKLIMDGDSYGSGRSYPRYCYTDTSKYSYSISDNNIPKMTKAEYYELDNDTKSKYSTIIVDDTLNDDKKPKYITRTYDDQPETTLYPTSTDISYNMVTAQDSINEMEKELNKLKENMNRQLNITMLHGCRNCGAKMDVDINKPVFYCKYCGTSYVIGTVQQNSTY